MSESAQCIDRSSVIETTLSDVTSFSVEEKKSPSHEERVNRFLDAILELKQYLSKKSERLADIADRMEAITWHNDPSENELRLITLLIATGRDVNSVLKREYAAFSRKFRNKGIAKEEIKEFHACIHDLDEACYDLESVFFHIPNDPKWAESNAKLKKLV